LSSDSWEACGHREKDRFIGTIEVISHYGETQNLHVDLIEVEEVETEHGRSYEATTPENVNDVNLYKELDGERMIPLDIDGGLYYMIITPYSV